MLLVYPNDITEASWDGDEMKVNGNEKPSCVRLNVISDCIVLFVHLIGDRNRISP